MSRRTGISAEVLRAWEKRYRAVVPSRSPTGRRLYSDADIERLKLLRRVVEAGFSIGKVASLADAELAPMVQAEESAVEIGAKRSPPAKVLSEQDGLAMGIEAIRGLDPARLEAVLQESAVRLGEAKLVKGVVVPILQRIGELWEKGELRPVHEHLASVVVRSFLDTVQRRNEAPDSAPRIIATTPPGQLHEMGALLVAGVASTLGWRATYLGPNLPTEDIVAAALQLEARAVALSIIYPSTDPRLPGELRRLRSLLGPEVLLVVGGSGAAVHSALLAEIGAVLVRDIGDLPAVLRRAASTQQSWSSEPVE